MAHHDHPTSAPNDLPFERRRNPLRRLLYAIKRLFVQDVPEADAQCEFSCRETQCDNERWTTCSTRIRAQNEANAKKAKR